MPHGLGGSKTRCTSVPRVCSLGLSSAATDARLPTGSPRHNRVCHEPRTEWTGGAVLASAAGHARRHSHYPIIRTTMLETTLMRAGGASRRAKPAARRRGGRAPHARNRSGHCVTLDAALTSLCDAQRVAAAVGDRARVEDGVACVCKLLHGHPLGGVSVEEAQHVCPEDAEALAHRRCQALALPRQRLISKQLRVNLHAAPREAPIPF